MTPIRFVCANGHVIAHPLLRQAPGEKVKGGTVIPQASEAALAIVRLSLRQDEAAPLEQVEAYVAQALRDAGFRVERVNIEWLT